MGTISATVILAQGIVGRPGDGGPGTAAGLHCPREFCSPDVKGGSPVLQGREEARYGPAACRIDLNPIEGHSQ
jgi:hypothetical protein